MPIAFITAAEPGGYARAMAAALRALGRDAQTVTGDARAPDGARLIVDATCLPRAGVRPHAILLREHAPPAEDAPLRDAALLIAAGPLAAARARAAGVAPDRIHLIEAGAPDLPRSDGPRAAGPCRILSPGRQTDTAMLDGALERLTDLRWTRATVAATDRDAPEWNTAGVFALALRDDDDALMLTEALARGIPYAVTGTAPMLSALPLDAGVSAERGDHAGLSVAIRRVLFDATLRAAMADAAHLWGRALPRRSEQAARLAALVEA